MLEVTGMLVSSPQKPHKGLVRPKTSLNAFNTSLVLKNEMPIASDTGLKQSAFPILDNQFSNMPAEPEKKNAKSFDKQMQMSKVSKNEKRLLRDLKLKDQANQTSDVSLQSKQSNRWIQVLKPVKKPTQMR